MKRMLCVLFSIVLVIGLVPTTHYAYAQTSSDENGEQTTLTTTADDPADSVAEALDEEGSDATSDEAVTSGEDETSEQAETDSEVTDDESYDIATLNDTAEDPDATEEQAGGIMPYADEDIAFAVYSETDNSLTFYADSSVPSEDSTYNGKTVTAVYTGFDTDVYASDSSVPWYSYHTDITSVEFAESFENVKPISTAMWFGEFSNCTSIKGLSYLDTSNVTNMDSMFYLCNMTELDVSGFDTSKVTDISWMFCDCKSLTDLDVSSFDTSNVEYMIGMFSGCTSLTELDVSGFGTSNVTYMDYMFYGCSNLTTIYSDDSKFVTTAVISDADMFYDCPKLVGGNGTAFDSSKITSTMAHVDTADNPGYFTQIVKTTFAVYCQEDGSLTFYYGTAPEVGDTYNGKSVTEVYEGFENVEYSYSSAPWYSHASSITSVVFDESFKDVQPVSTAHWFDNFTNCTSIKGLSNLDTSKVTNMEGMFYNCSSLTELDVTGFDTSKVTNMEGMFADCYSLTKLDVSGFDTSKATDIGWMFYDCSSLTELDVSSFDTSNVTYMDDMFYGCSSLTTIYSDDSKFVTTAVTSDTNMFTGCTNLVGGNGTVFDSSNVTSTMAHVDTADNPGYFTQKAESDSGSGSGSGNSGKGSGTSGNNGSGSGSSGNNGSGSNGGTGTTAGNGTGTSGTAGNNTSATDNSNGTSANSTSTTGDNGTTDAKTADMNTPLVCGVLIALAGAAIAVLGVRRHFLRG